MGWGHCGNRDPVGGYDEPDGWGGACDNRDPAPRRRSSTPRVEHERPIVSQAEKHYNLTVEVVTSSGEHFTFELLPSIVKTLEVIDKEANERAQELCRERSQELRSCGIVSLVSA